MYNFKSGYKVRNVILRDPWTIVKEMYHEKKRKLLEWSGGFCITEFLNSRPLPFSILVSQDRYSEKHHSQAQKKYIWLLQIALFLQK